MKPKMFAGLARILLEIALFLFATPIMVMFIALLGGAGLLYRAVKQGICGLCLVLAIQAGLCIWAGPSYHGSDDRNYIEMAQKMNARTWNMQCREAFPRFSITVPTSIALKVFPRSPYAPFIWPFFCALAATSLVWLIAHNSWGAKEANIAALMFGLSPHVLRYGSTLVPQPILTCFLLLSALFLHYRFRHAIYPLLCSVSWWVAFMANEAAVYLLPFFLFIFIKDLRAGKASAWPSLFTMAFTLFAAHCALYWVALGNPFIRIIDGDMYATDWAAKSAWGFWRRMTIGPLCDVLLKRELYSYLFLLTVGYFFCGRKSDGYWTSFFLFTLGAFWFMPTSIMTYTPLEATTRYMFFLLPMLCILGAVTMTTLMDWYKRRHPSLSFLFRLWWVPFVALALYALWVGYFGEKYIYYVGKEGAPWNPLGPNPRL